jgi:hypothetical protein
MAVPVGMVLDTKAGYSSQVIGAESAAALTMTTTGITTTTAIFERNTVKIRDITKVTKKK